MSPVRRQRRGRAGCDWESDGAPGRIRTCDLALRRRLLCPLSYGDASTLYATDSVRASPRDGLAMRTRPADRASSIRGIPSLARRPDTACRRQSTPGGDRVGIEMDGSTRPGIDRTGRCVARRRRHRRPQPRACGLCARTDRSCDDDIGPANLSTVDRSAIDDRGSRTHANTKPHAAGGACAPGRG